MVTIDATIVGDAAFDPADPAFDPADPAFDVAAQAAYTYAPSLRGIAEVEWWCVGGGGTGSWFLRNAMGLFYMLEKLQEAHLEEKRLPPQALGRVRSHRVHLVDDDLVEEKNVGRQAHSVHHVGLLKAYVEAIKARQDLDLEILHHASRFDPAMVETPHGGDYGASSRRLTVLVGCVDNIAARVAMARVVRERGAGGHVIHVDAGNDRWSGQVLVGDAPEVTYARHAFNELGLATRMPAPHLLAPVLFTGEDDPEEERDAEDDCAARIASGQQSPMINRAMGLALCDVVCRLILGTLSYFSLEVDCADGLRVVPIELRPALVAARLTRWSRSADDLGLILRTPPATPPSPMPAPEAASPTPAPRPRRSFPRPESGQKPRRRSHRADRRAAERALAALGGVAGATNATGDGPRTS